MEICDYILQNEKKIHSRATVLQCQKKSFLKVLRLGYQVVKLDDKAEEIRRRIEARGSVAKDVTLDVAVFRPKVAMSLLEEITQSSRRDQFASQLRPIIIVPPTLQSGSLTLGNI